MSFLGTDTFVGAFFTSPAALYAYTNAKWAAFLADGTLPRWNCRFGNPDWYSCYITDWYVPLLIAWAASTMGLFVQGLQHWGFYATIGTDDTYLSFFTGIHNVYTMWYVLDSQIGAFFTFFEFLINSIFILVMGFNMLRFNTTWTSPYAYLGVLTFMFGYLYQSNQAFLMAYLVINSSYLQSRYDPFSITTIEFPNAFNQFDGKNDTWLTILNYLWQIIVGNKRLALYTNFMAAVSLSFHPITIPFSLYYWAQLPAQIVLDIFIYPWLPQFDTPQIPWYEFFYNY